jgi:hypothetical protein
MFNTLHTLVETDYTELSLEVDEIAERLRAGGARAPGSYREFSKLSLHEKNAWMGEAASTRAPRRRHGPGAAVLRWRPGSLEGSRNARSNGEGGARDLRALRGAARRD